jgi:hypothetical protein
MWCQSGVAGELDIVIERTERFFELKIMLHIEPSNKTCH